jgi:peptidoglycan/LPS O-acetylase OafA/YrhL
MSGHALAYEPANGRFTLIDGSRFIAAFCVLLFHYQWFYQDAVGSKPGAGFPDAQPFYSFLWPLTTYGHWAVEMFWVISGFVFFATYVNRTTTTRSFVVNRIARLYPLHFTTLLIVAAIEINYYRIHGEYISYLVDLKHFILNLFMASQWGMQDNLSFNGPFWSVSIEILIYVLFWAALPLLKRFGGKAAGGFVLAMMVTLALPLPAAWVQQCACYFFIGGCIWFLISHPRATPIRVLAIPAAAMVLALVLMPLFPERGRETYVAGSVFFLFISALAVAERWANERVRRIAAQAGDLTYGMYLWHFPIAATVITLCGTAHTNPNFYSSPLTLLGFITATLLMAYASFRLFERPARDYIRRFAKSGRARHKELAVAP